MGLLKRKANLIGRRFGDLVVRRDLGGDTFHCDCDPKDRECTRFRTVTRTQLVTRVVYQCLYCAREAKMQKRSRRSPNRVEPPLPPEPAPKKGPLPPCNGCTIRIIEGRPYRAVQPDCRLHSPLYKEAPEWERKGQAIS